MAENGVIVLLILFQINLLINFKAFLSGLVAIISVVHMFFMPVAVSRHCHRNKTCIIDMYIHANEEQTT